MAQGTPVKHKKKTKSVLKNIRQAEARQAINRMNRTRVRTAMRRLRAALTAGDAAAAEKLTSPTFSELDTANRYKSRLALALNALKSKKKA
jgi:small subunit ribosomal protein S20